MNYCNVCSNDEDCTECEEGHYFSSWTCASCSEGCASCPNITECKRCKEGYLLIREICVYAPNCLQYSKSIGCTQCEDGFYDNNGFCIPV